MRQCALQVHRKNCAKVHQQRRWQRKSQPRRHCADPPGAMQADGKSNLTTGRSGKNLAQSYQAPELLARQPVTLLNIAALEIPDVRDRAAKRREPEFQSSTKYLCSVGAFHEILKLVLEPCSNCAWHSGMRHIVSNRRSLIFQTRNIIILDVIPFDVGNVEDVERRSPLFAFPEAELSIDRRIGRGFGAVVVRQWRFAKMPRTKCPEPSGLALRG